jgi:hypothetical protein
LFLTQQTQKIVLKKEIAQSEFRSLETAIDDKIENQKKAELERIKNDLATEAEKKRKELKKAVNDKSEAHEGGIYIQNAGIVLLWPFFGFYFAKVGLMQNNIFINQQAAHRAVHLLQYLAFGIQQNHEYQLVLNKILCNVEISEPVPSEIVMTDVELEASAELLTVVTQRWEKLKNTSIDGLRVSFLQRDGHLIEEAEGWKLRVEQKAFDVLLQSLPWTISMIKTSWMDKIINVEWT